MAQADSQNTITTSAIDRRGFFRRFLAVPAFLAMPTMAIGANAPTDIVSPPFKKLLPAMDRAEEGFREAHERQKAALEGYHKLCPPVPSKLLYQDGRDPAKLYSALEFGMCPTGAVQYDQPLRMTAENLRVLGKKKHRPEQNSRRVRYAAQLRLPIAEEYEAAQAASRELSGIETAMEAVREAERAVVKIVSAVGNLRPQTMPDLIIKAQAAMMFAEVRKNATGLLYGEHNALCVADGLAIDIVRAVAISRGMAV